MIRKSFISNDTLPCNANCIPHITKDLPQNLAPAILILITRELPKKWDNYFLIYGLTVRFLAVKCINWCTKKTSATQRAYAVGGCQGKNVVCHMHLYFCKCMQMMLVLVTCKTVNFVHKIYQLLSFGHVTPI